MQWDPHEVVDNRVVEASVWWLDIKEFEQLEKRSGVYLFANSKYEVKYVGKAGAGEMVKEIKKAITKKKSKGATQVRALYTNAHDKAKSLAQYLVDKYDPVNNRRKK